MPVRCNHSMIKLINRLLGLLEPLRVFLALVIASLFVFAPLTLGGEPRQPSVALLKPFASSADACPFACIRCTVWDPDAWPRNCLEWRCIEEDECGGGGGTTQPPAISHILTCSQNGNGGWCIGNLSLDLTASDPQNAQVIISGDVHGNPFACPSGATTCSVPLPEGTGNANYKVDSATGLSAAGSTTYELDATTPQISGSISASLGANGWYIFPAVGSAWASDAISGIAAFEMNVNNGGWVAYSDVSFTDGIHSIQYRALDYAGNLTQTAAQEIKVDTVTPSLSLDVSGARGQNGWYVSNVTVNPTVADATSGVARVEAKVNSGEWTVISDPLPIFSDGVHTYQIKVTDQAGNITETPLLTLMVDSVPPAIAIYDDTLDLGDTLYYDLEDSLSGLWINRSVIEDDDEKYKKVVWLEELTGRKSNNNEIRWDGVFADGTKAAPGQYFITLKVSDQAGNETMRTAIVEVTAFNSLLPISAFTPPASDPPLPQGEGQGEGALEFGGANNGTAGTETTTTSGAAVFAGMSAQAAGAVSFTSGNRSSNLPTTNTNLLWGAAAAALLGATLAEWQKRRQEEEARRREAARVAQQEKNAEKKAEQARLAYLNAAYQAKLDREKAQKKAAAPDPRLEDEELAFLKRTYAQTVRKANVISSRPKQAANSAAQSYAAWAKAAEQGRFDQQAYVKAAERAKEQNTKSPWVTIKDRFQEKTERFVWQPPPWLSISYQGRLFDWKNLFTDEMIYPQFSARNGFETWVYQSLSVSIDTTSKLTSNPPGWVDLNFSNGRITFKGEQRPDGSRVDYFIQPFALSAGQISSIPMDDDSQTKTVNVSTIDIDVLSVKNWASLKVSQSTGLSTSETYPLPTGETIEASESIQLQTTVNIHRWPRILVVAGVLYYVWVVAGVGVALKAAVASAPLVQQAIQAIP